MREARNNSPMPTEVPSSLGRVLREVLQGRQHYPGRLSGEGASRNVLASQAWQQIGMVHTIVVAQTST